MLYSYITEKEGKKEQAEKRRKKNEKRKRKHGRLDKKEKGGGRTYVCFVAFACSVPCRARFIVALRRVPQASGASSLLSVSRIIINSRQQQQQPHQH